MVRNGNLNLNGIEKSEDFIVSKVQSAWAEYTYLDF